AMAAEKTIEVQGFSAVDAQKGINITIKCAATSSLKVKGMQSSIDKLNITHNGDTLSLINDAVKKDSLLTKALDITLYTDHPLNTLVTKTGVKMEVDACAIDNEKLEVSGEMGSKIDIAGKTKQLDLNLNMGAVFNKVSQKFSADSAKVYLSMGANASLCHIPKITGNLTTGTHISVDKKSIVKTTDNFASKISTDSCS
ncbi:GIN domain-containing protein, partial [Xenorhabdus sp. IM139775]|uniref:GIN domain-containing protein n=1 Tax=Xenorhabdus sp. IM139775 TaxID=3025876 RepID=UPI0023597559